MSCDACKLRKIHQESFPSIAIKTNKPLQLIHSDVWGPSPNISIEDWEGNFGSYYLLLKNLVLLHCPSCPATSTIVPIVDNIVSTTCTHVVQPITATMSQPLLHTSTNIHSMQTMSKSGIYKPKVYTAVVVLLDHFQEPLVFRQALQLPHWKITMEAKYSTFVRNAKLVAKGFQQQANVDFSDTFTPIVKAPTIRIIFSLVVAYNWDIQQVDINNAFLNGILHEDVYMCQPEGALVSWGFQPSVSDNFLFRSQKNGHLVLALTFRFALKTLVSISYFLRFEAFRDSSDLYLNQSKYISDLLVKKNMVHAKPSSTPMALGQKVALEDSAPFPDVTLYHSTICFSDADWACNVDDRRSTTGYCVFLGGNLVTRSSRKEQVVARSRTESKYWAMASVTMELIWIKSLQDEL
ncbi:Retrovirus-related Pol polyprotein from transposon RE2 [Vitis vinifera]|uniref:Retrovirus-related Pol polyprotein from transposon RE2 n=1 Tax=Vitis vinifera TaxID=29760 RepID=A0A438HI51_VITVI|nr:Retrovirus-related Pol polyprotein from transposon RE2 [Vitis vinifera]